MVGLATVGLLAICQGTNGVDSIVYLDLDDRDAVVTLTRGARVYVRGFPKRNFMGCCIQKNMALNMRRRDQHR